MVEDGRIIDLVERRVGPRAIERPVAQPYYLSDCIDEGQNTSFQNLDGPVKSPNSQILHRLKFGGVFTRCEGTGLT